MTKSYDPTFAPGMATPRWRCPPINVAHPYERMRTKPALSNGWCFEINDLHSDFGQHRATCRAAAPAPAREVRRRSCSVARAEIALRRERRASARPPLHAITAAAATRPASRALMSRLRRCPQPPSMHARRPNYQGPAMRRQSPHGRVDRERAPDKPSDAKPAGARPRFRIASLAPVAVQWDDSNRWEIFIPPRPISPRVLRCAGSTA